MALQNRFKNCSVSCSEKPNNAYTDVVDILWYPERKQILVQKRDKQNLVIDVSKVIPDEQPTNKNIFVWDPTLHKNRILVPEGTPCTDAMQMIATEINNNFKNNFVWKIWVDE